MLADLSPTWRTWLWSRPRTCPSTSCAPRRSSSRSCWPWCTTAAGTPSSCRSEKNKNILFCCNVALTWQMKTEIGTENDSRLSLQLNVSYVPKRAQALPSLSFGTFHPPFFLSAPVERDSQPNTQNLLLFIQTHPHWQRSPTSHQEREIDGGSASEIERERVRERESEKKER